MLQLLGRLFWAYMYTSVLHPLEEGTFYLGWDHSNIHQQGIAHLSMARCKHSYSRQIPPPICWPRLYALPYKNYRRRRRVTQALCLFVKVPPLLAPDSVSCSRAQGKPSARLVFAAARSFGLHFMRGDSSH